MKTMTATDARKRFGELLKSAASEPVFIRKNGREVAVLVSPEEYDKAADLGEPAMLPLQALVYSALKP